MKLDKKILFWQIIFKSCGAVTAISFIQESKLWVGVFGILMAISSEMKDYYLKKQNPPVKEG